MLLVVLLVALLGALRPAYALDLSALWDFENPALSAERFRRALAGASPDDALILQTQIARTYGLRGEFPIAQAILESIASQVRGASPEVRVRYALEYGRTLSSAAHTPESQTPEVKDKARAAFLGAYQLARSAKLDGLAIDALHMMAFVDTAPGEQLNWDEQALALSRSSSQPEAKRWEASLLNNTGYALHELGRYPEALDRFNAALALRENATDIDATRAARWMVAWTLRPLGRTDEALAIQQSLERECDASGTPDADVYAELEILYRERGDTVRADHYLRKRKALTP